MRIAALDLMPLLFGMCAAASVLLARAGDTGSPARAIPAVLAAYAVYFAHFPPRVQVAMFAALYALDALVWLLLQKIAAARRRRAARLSQTE